MTEEELEGEVVPQKTAEETEAVNAGISRSQLRRIRESHWRWHTPLDEDTVERR